MYLGQGVLGYSAQETGRQVIGTYSFMPGTAPKELDGSLMKSLTHGQSAPRHLDFGRHPCPASGQASTGYLLTHGMYEYWSQKLNWPVPVISANVLVSRPPDQWNREAQCNFGLHHAARLRS